MSSLLREETPNLLICLFRAVFILFAGDWLGHRLSIILGATVMIIGVFPFRWLNSLSDELSPVLVTE
jgi:dipeptide/tripeptide permease